jgi:hypothetical protein
VDEAIVEESTTVNRAAGHETWTPRHLATARTRDGLLLIIGLPAPVADGSCVYLTERDGAPFALEQAARDQ